MNPLAITDFKKNYIFILLILLKVQLISVTLITKQDCYLYPHLFPEEINPFLYSNKKIPIKKNTSLLLIEEIEYSHPFWGDILKVQINTGSNQGETGFILESQCRLVFDNHPVYIMLKKTLPLPEVKISAFQKLQIIHIENRGS
ncbi:MAG: hypothetical protein MJB14_13120, partial [Spirochaetes bacterium]|nr:hypothetical protein [Spirochaetota bacterium]